jgi:hypothetical protein
MDHSCYKCEQSVEDGVPFCSHCGAPQIRVAIAEHPPLQPEGSVSTLELPASLMDQPAAQRPLRVPELSRGIDWPRALGACSGAAVISVLAMSLRLLPPLLAELGAGFLAVFIYGYRNPTPLVGARSGARLGALAGLLSSSIIAILSAIAFAVLQAGGEIRQQALDTLQQLASRSKDPQVQAAVDLFKNPDGLASKLILAAVGFLLFSLVAGSVAGALTGAFLARRNRP